MRFIALFFVGYSVAWWGSTLLMGGPQGTGSWPFMYAMLKLGTPPPTPPVKGGSNETQSPFQAGSNITTPSPSSTTGSPSQIIGGTGGYYPSA